MAKAVDYLRIGVWIAPNSIIEAEMASRGPKPGMKVGGRQKGTPNRATAERQRQIAESGMTPLDYLLSVMRDENEPPDARLDAAKAAAPYVHPRLSAIEHSGDLTVSHEDRLIAMEAAANFDGKSPDVQRGRN